MPFIRSITFKRCVLLAISISFNKEIINPYSYYIKKGLIYITLSRRKRTLHLYVVTATNLGFLRANTEILYSVQTGPSSSYGH
jgi:hypothetical protein